MRKDYQELVNIKDLIKEAYKIDTNKIAVLGIDKYKIKYLMLDTWCNTLDNKLLLLKIIYKLINMYPHRLEYIAHDLFYNFSIVKNGTQEIYILYSLLIKLLLLKAAHEN